MFSLDRWEEILSTVARHPLRSILTAVSMAWGIFMLVVLLGLGAGLETGAKSEFNDDATNSIWIFGGQTSVPHQGLPIGRRIQFRNPDVDAVKATPGVEHLTGRFFISGGMFGGELKIRNGNKVSSFDVRAVHPDHLYLEKSQMIAGRYLNDADLADMTKVCVIGQPVAEFFFGDADPMGQWIEINEVAFRIVGVFFDEGGEGELRKIYVPITTAQRVFNGADRVNQLMFTMGNMGVADSKALADKVKALLAERHDFSAQDPQAARIRNNLENYASFAAVFEMISIFVWGMGLCTIIAGVVGISNIMMIVVKERTREIGIRKALGATPSNIVTSIVQESVFLTLAAGALGLAGGVLLLEIITRYVPSSDFLKNPHVDAGISAAAIAVLVFAGTFAGAVPAWTAARVNPIEALRDE